MSRSFDAKQAAIKAYPQDRDSGVILFLEYLDCSEGDFMYENNVSAEKYIYGDDTPTTESK